MKNNRVLLFLILPLLLCTLGSCRKKGFSIVGYWDIYWNGSPTSVRYEFTGTPDAGSVVEVGGLPAYQNHSYVIEGSQVTLKFYNFHGIGWSRRTCTGMINEEEERIEGTYAGQTGGTQNDPIYDFSGTWMALKVQ